jgi:hypothetical protein
MSNGAGQPPPGSTASGWSVIGQEEQVGLDAYNRPVKGMLVRFQTAKGVAGSVFVPMTEYRKENVRAAIAQAVSEIDAVHQLRG